MQHIDQSRARSTSSLASDSASARSERHGQHAGERARASLQQLGARRQQAQPHGTTIHLALCGDHELRSTNDFTKLLAVGC